MPRQPRLDAPGLLQHVMARGIERRKIFKDDKDRKSFLTRFADILEETQTQCYAWALIPNHFHLLLRTGPTPLSKVMRRLMTGYAVTFNKRHRRSGHLFQNRYRSIVCEEDPYLLELIRYIHLNPLRAGLVKDQRALDKYLWSGHSVILGRRKNPLMPSYPPARPQGLICSDSDPSSKISTNQQTSHFASFAPSRFNDKSLAEKTIEDILLHFGDTIKVSRRRYREFVKKGIDQGRRADLQGGGLVRSAGGDKRNLLGRRKEEREKGDERILGGGDFVNEILRKAEMKFERKYLPKRPIEELVEMVASHLDLNMERIMSASRKKKISEARALICHFALNDLSYSASEVARFLEISRVNAGRCAIRGKKLLDNYKELRQFIQ
jgi:putative transposase